MDHSGALLPGVRATVREGVQAAEPLMAHDVELRHQLDRFLSLPGTGRANSYLQSLPELRAFNEALEERLVAALSAGSIGGTQPLNRETLQGSVAAIVDRLHRTEICLTLARNGTLSAADYARTVKYLERLDREIAETCYELLSSGTSSLSSIRLLPPW